MRLKSPFIFILLAGATKSRALSKLNRRSNRFAIGRGGLALRSDPTERDDDAFIGNGQCAVHVLLDEQDGQAGVITQGAQQSHDRRGDNGCQSE